MAKKIPIPDGADPAAVLQTVERAAASVGFTLEPTGPTTATAHDGDAPVTGGSALATRARVAVRVLPGRVELTSETTGAAYAGAAGVGFFQTRINWRYSRFARAVRKALA